MLKKLNGILKHFMTRDGKLMNITQFSLKYGLSLDTLRFYEKRKVLIPDRLANGYRNYTETHEKKTILIICLKKIGFSLEEIKSLLELEDKPPSIECNVISNQLFDKKIEMIGQQINLLQFGKTALLNIKKYIENDSFLENQELINIMIADLYEMIKIKS